MSVPDVKVIWVGRPDKQFTDQEIQKLAGYNMVVLDNLHGGYPFSSEFVQEAARRITAINPKVKVFPYFSLTKVRSPLILGNTSNPIGTFWKEGFQESMFLHGSDNNTVNSYGAGLSANVIAGKYIDLGNPAMRDWALAMFKKWFAAAPFAGIAFDEADPIGSRTKDTDLNKVSAAQKTAWQAGQKALIQATHDQNPGKLIIYNGSPDTYLKTTSANMELEAVHHI
jgi:hypothetical protein